jgi:hypothetical protein
MANAVTIHRPSWQQGFDDSARSLPSRCPPDADAFSYLSGYLAGLNDRQEQSAETPSPADVPAPAAPQGRRRRGGRYRASPRGQRQRTLTGTFGRPRSRCQRARLQVGDGRTSEWQSSALRAYQRRTLAADALIAGTYLAGTNTRRVRRAMKALFGGTVGKDMVSRTWRKVKGDWDAWNARSLADEPIVRLILDGTVVRVRLDRKATAISLLVVLGVRADGQKILLAIKSEGASYCP